MLVVKTARNRERNDLSRRNGAVHQLWSGDPLLQSLTGPAPVDVPDVLAEYPAQVVLSEDDNVIEARAPDAPQEPLISSCGLRRRSCTNPWTGGAGRKASRSIVLIDVIMPPKAAQTRARRTANTVRHLDRIFKTCSGRISPRSCCGPAK